MCRLLLPNYESSTNLDKKKHFFQKETVHRGTNCSKTPLSDVKEKKGGCKGRERKGERRKGGGGWGGVDSEEDAKNGWRDKRINSPGVSSALNDARTQSAGMLNVVRVAQQIVSVLLWYTIHAT